MHDRSGRNLLLTGALVSALFAAQSQADVYKVVDEHGNVVFTDQPPDPDASPLVLPGLSVIGTARPELPGRPAEDEAGDETGEPEIPIGELRRSYRDFAIVSPLPEEVLSGSANSVTVAWDTRYRLQPGMTVTLYLDGQAQEPTTASATLFRQLDRGAHTVYGVLKDARNRKIVNTPPVTFHIRQYSANFGVNG